MPQVEVVALEKTYPPPPFAWLRGRRARPRPALRGLSFHVDAGEVVALIGPNGAGKSTLLRILCGLLLPEGGHARVAGLDVVEGRPEVRRHVGAALSDDRGLSPRLTPRQNLRFFAALYDVPSHEVDPRIEELARMLEAQPLMDREVRTLSSGEKARVVLMRAMLHQPRVLLLDEVTRSLDPGAARRVRTRVLGEAAARGTAVLFASHDLEEVRAVAARVVLLDQGRIAAQGRYADVHPAAQALFALAEAPA
ncbi:ABC transporter ATP-binding protein [Corallococcus sp. M34]|uniref:ABC transporter ATP-binding protein n=1 Tax=Citreicoccus inhibens TaxID=2849499 RepID=UPI000E72FA10|nr:ABC transporter ATP-binding protein [Citreicoccus inhibens]MBU8896031.1 ABC transporter ATP-binding protein [Citreicoccus inhibens]